MKVYGTLEKAQLDVTSYDSDPSLARVIPGLIWFDPNKRRIYFADGVGSIQSVAGSLTSYLNEISQSGLAALGKPPAGEIRLLNVEGALVLQFTDGTVKDLTDAPLEVDFSYTGDLAKLKSQATPFAPLDTTVPLFRGTLRSGLVRFGSIRKHSLNFPVVSFQMFARKREALITSRSGDYYASPATGVTPHNITRESGNIFQTGMTQANVTYPNDTNSYDRFTLSGAAFPFKDMPVSLVENIGGSYYRIYFTTTKALDPDIFAVGGRIYLKQTGQTGVVLYIDDVDLTGASPSVTVHVSPLFTVVEETDGTGRLSILAVTATVTPPTGTYEDSVGISRLLNHSFYIATDGGGNQSEIFFKIKKITGTTVLFGEPVEFRYNNTEVTGGAGVLSLLSLDFVRMGVPFLRFTPRLGDNISAELPYLAEGERVSLSGTGLTGYRYANLDNVSSTTEGIVFRINGQTSFDVLLRGLKDNIPVTKPTGSIRIDTHRYLITLSQQDADIFTKGKAGDRLFTKGGDAVIREISGQNIWIYVDGTDTTVVPDTAYSFASTKKIFALSVDRPPHIGVGDYISWQSGAQVQSLLQVTDVSANTIVVESADRLTGPLPTPVLKTGAPHLFVTGNTIGRIFASFRYMSPVITKSVDIYVIGRPNVKLDKNDFAEGVTLEEETFLTLVFRELPEADYEGQAYDFDLRLR